MPKTKTEWWLNKINRNQKNDALKRIKLKKIGWRVIEVFECELKKDKLDKTISRIIKKIKTHVL